MNLRFLGVGQYIFAAAALVALVLTIIMSLYLRDYITRLSVAEYDQRVWNSTQLEVEYLKFRDTLSEQLAADSPDLGEVRERFDIFYSRIPLIDPATLDPGAQWRLANLRTTMDGLIALIDGPDDALSAGLETLASTIGALSGQARTIALGAIDGVVEAKEQDRQAVVLVLEAMLALVIVTTLFLILAVIFLMHRTAMQRNSALLATERHHQLAATIRGSLAAIVVSDSNGRVVDFNGSAERMFGLHREQVLGQRATEIMIPEPYRARMNDNLEKFLTTGQTTMLEMGKFELSMLRSDRSEFPVEFSVSMAETRNGPIFISYIRDITDEYRRADELKKARDAALQAVKDRSRFFANMSHEMRTPLNGVLSSLYLLEETNLSEDQRGHVKTALFSGDILMGHINDVLTIERCEGEEAVDPQPCDLAALCSSLITMMQPQAADGDVVLDFHQVGLNDRRFMTEPRAIQQILINLLSNAIKFSPKGGVSLFAQYHAPEQPNAPGKLRFEVNDTGIGIASEDQQRIFEDFVSLDDRYERRTGGTGLGLGIVQRLVERLDGSLRCESEIGEGSLFIVDLPIEEAAFDAETAREDESPTRRNSGPKHILAVDDNQINLDLMRQMIEISGHKVTAVTCGQAAVDIATRQSFDMILMDISMPKMSGTQACQRIRARPGPNQKTPIIAFTAQALPSEQEVFLAAGMSGVLLKPVNLDTLQKFLDGDYPDAARDQPPHDTGETSKRTVLNHKQVSDMKDLFEDGQLSDHLEQFFEAGQDLVTKLSVAHRQKNYSEVQSISHALSGMSGMMGSGDLSQLAQKIEQACKTGQLALVDELMPDVAPLFALTCEAWTEELV